MGDRHGRRNRAGGDDPQPLSALLPGITASVKPLPPEKPMTPQRRHHHTTSKQITELMAIPQDSPEMGFMTRLLTLCSLPRTDPGTRMRYVRRNGPYTLGMTAGVDNKLPFGNLPRLLLAWVCTEAVRTQGRELLLGNSLAEFMRELGMLSDSGGIRADRTRLRDQIDRLFSCNVELIYQADGVKRGVASLIADERELWWDYKTPEQDTLWQSRIRLGEKLYQEIVTNPVPLDMRILKAMRRSSLGLDLYLWLSYKTYTLLKASGPGVQRLTWHQIYAQFGKDPTMSSDTRTVDDFRKDVLRELRKLKLCWPALDYSTPKGALVVRGCIPSIVPRELPAGGTGKPA